MNRVILIGDFNPIRKVDLYVIKDLLKSYDKVYIFIKDEHKTRITFLDRTRLVEKVIKDIPPSSFEVSYLLNEENINKRLLDVDSRVIVRSMIGSAKTNAKEEYLIESINLEKEDFMFHYYCFLDFDKNKLLAIPEAIKKDVYRIYEEK